jgi:maltose/moltooligosaccharide transporter
MSQASVFEFHFVPPSRVWIAYLGASFSVGVFNAFNNFTLTLWLSGFTGSYLLLGLLGNSRSFEGALVSPLMGRWSDRLWFGWLGRRRPFILVGGLLAALLLALLPALTRMPLPKMFGSVGHGDATGLIMAIVGIFLFTLAFNSMDDLHKALLADIARPADRNWLSGLSVVVDTAGQVTILLLGFLLWTDAVPDLAFAITGILVAAGVVFTVVGVREPAPAVWSAERILAARDSKSNPELRHGISRYQGAIALCGVQFAYWTGLSAVLPLVSVYTRDTLGATVGEAQLLPAMMLVASTLLAIPVAKLGDRLGKRRVLTVGYAMMGAVAVAGLSISTVPQGAVLFVLAGIANAAIMVITLPLLAELVPHRHMGLATGALAASGSLAAPLSSLLAGQLADMHGPRAIFAVMAVMTVAALGLIPFVRAPRAAGTCQPALAPSGGMKDSAASSSV